MPENEVEVCKHCGESIAPEHRVIHHLSYEPEVTIPMHRSCHSEMHHSHADSELKPPEDGPGRPTLFNDNTAITVYIKKAKLEKLDKLCGLVARNRMLNKLIDDFIEGK